MVSVDVNVTDEVEVESPALEEPEPDAGLPGDEELPPAGPDAELERAGLDDGPPMPPPGAEDEVPAEAELEGAELDGAPAPETELDWPEAVA